MNKGIILSLLLSAMLSLQAYGQNGASIYGKVYSSEGEALSFATVVLYHQADSSLAKADYTDDIGSFAIQRVVPGEYYLEISYIGLPLWTKNSLTMESGASINMDKIEMEAAGMDLSEVVVSTSRALIEVRADRTIFNVGASVTAAGSDGFELLRKAPGVVIDNNDNIQMRGKSGVLVYMDGKQSFLSPQELANLLRSLNASDIESIEVITNPSARYDAAGNAGIINIILKKDKGLGTNGTFNYSAAYGLQFRTNASVNLNHRNKNFNIYGSTGVSINNFENGLNIYRIQNGKVFDQQQSQVHTSYPVNARVGMDYFLNPKHTLGFLANTFTSTVPTEMRSQSQVYISSEASPDQIDSILKATNDIDMTRLNANFNLNYRYADSETGREFTFDADRGVFRSTSDSYQPNMYYQPDEQTIIRRTVSGNKAPSDIDILSFKADYEQKLWPTATIATGLKWTSVTTNNTFEFYNYDVNDAPIRDPERSNHFTYQENVSAAYLNLNSNINPMLSFQAGIRLEHTYSLGDLTRDPGQAVSPEDYVERNYMDWFPSAALTWQLHPMHALNATYSRRVNRPNYQQLNPFEWRLDELSYRKGSPFLSPQYANAYELKYIAFQMVNFSVGYTKTTDLITDIVEPSQTEPDKSFINYRNLASQDHYSIGLSAPTPIKQWWNGYINMSVFQSLFKADFDEYQFELTSPVSFNIYAEQSFRIRPTTTLEISGWYNSGSIWGGNWVTEPQGSLDFGVQQRMFNNKATLKLSFTDILNTAPWRGKGDVIPGFTVYGSGYWDSRQVRLNFSYRFGNMEVRGARQRRTGIDAESRRIGE